MRARPVALSIALALLAAGCSNLHPLYGDGDEPSSVAAQLATVSIPEPDTRLAQIIRNDLLSTMRPVGTAAPDHYTLAFNIRAQEDKTIESATAERVLRRTIRLSVAFTLQEHGTGKVVFRGKTFSQASYDQVGQSFADLQAKTEAAERAAHEVSVDIRTRLAAHFAS